MLDAILAAPPVKIPCDLSQPLDLPNQHKFRNRRHPTENPKNKANPKNKVKALFLTIPKKISTNSQNTTSTYTVCLVNTPIGNSALRLPCTAKLLYVNAAPTTVDHTSSNFPPSKASLKSISKNFKSRPSIPQVSCPSPTGAPTNPGRAKTTRHHRQHCCSPQLPTNVQQEKNKKPGLLYGRRLPGTGPSARQWCHGSRVDYRQKAAFSRQWTPETTSHRLPGAAFEETAFVAKQLHSLH